MRDDAPKHMRVIKNLGHCELTHSVERKRYIHCIIEDLQNYRILQCLTEYKMRSYVL